jgi:cytochrome c-type biogenesis protein CcmF
VISIIGNFLLILSLISYLGAILLRNTPKLVAFYLGSTAPIIAFVSLVIAFTISDFNIKNVFLNSSSMLPIIYKIAASWASHEGSMLLFVALLSIMCIIYLYVAAVTSSSKEFAIIIFAFIQALFIGFILLVSNPFESFSFTPGQGTGLNPMLQDMALSIHPPLLYIGNVSYVALFVSGCLILHSPHETKKILTIAKKFSSFALMNLTVGIGLGAWWAYRELGWGGFWFFDPVENISLMPWLVGIALHHFLILSAKSGQYLKWTIALSLTNFLLILYGTFIVRSGIISSVHAFAFSPERGLYIFAICITLTILSLMWFLWKRKKLPKSKAAVSTSERLILIGNILWITSLLSIIITLIYPIYCSYIDGIEIAIDPAYFTSVFIPIFIPILILAAIAPTIIRHCEESTDDEAIQEFLDRRAPTALAMTSVSHYFYPIILSLLITYILTFWINFKLVSFCISFAAIYLMLQTIISLLKNHTSPRKYALFLGHFGFGLLALSITCNILLTQKIDFKGEVGNKVSEQHMTVTLKDIKFAEGPNYYRQIVIFEIEDKGGNITILKPENRLYKIENTLSQEADIYSFLFNDLYAVLNRIDKNTIHATIYQQPFISFIWLSVFIIAAGFLLLLLGRK